MSRETKIFVIYVSDDEAVAMRVDEYLAHSDLWTSHTLLGLSSDQSFKIALRSRISAADILIILLSPAVLASSWIKRELETAIQDEYRKRAITVIPVKVQSCRVPSYMTVLPVVNLTQDFDKGMRKLVDLLNAVRLVDFDKLSPDQFEALVGDLLKAHGFKNIRRPMSMYDHEYDFSATYYTRDPFGRVEPVEWLVEVKRRAMLSDITTLRSFLGAVNLRGKTVRALFVTSNQLTSAAREWVEELRTREMLQFSVLEDADLKYLILAKPKLISKHFQK